MPECLQLVVPLVAAEICGEKSWKTNVHLNQIITLVAEELVRVLEFVVRAEVGQERVNQAFRAGVGKVMRPTLKKYLGGSQLEATGRKCFNYPAIQF